VKHGQDYAVRTIDSSVEVPDVIFVNIGTRRLFWLWRMRRKGVKILHRLDGVVWREFLQDRGVKISLLCHVRNFIMAFIRRRLADVVIYQSEFIRKSWDERFGAVSTPSRIIYNGTNPDLFYPVAQKREGKPVLLCVEGEIQRGSGVTEMIVALAEALIPDVLGGIVLVGKLTPEDHAALGACEGVRVRGKIPREEMPTVFQGADLFMNLEVNPPCPNSMLEALASGLPVAAFDTGAARELVGDVAGVLVPYGSDPWKLEAPNAKGMIEGVRELVERLDVASLAARKRVIEQFTVDRMLQEYAEALQSIFPNSQEA
jgi:glycosyltransferase involved in cell wall biosynthesis